jgi:hypothetical protein
MALPSILFAMSKPSSEIILTDRPVPNLQTWKENMNNLCLINGVSAQTTLLPLSWGCFDADLMNWSANNKVIDVITASDCFYDTKDFDDVLATVRFFFDHHQCRKFITTYHERSENRNLQFLLRKWKFESVTEIPLESFLSHDNFKQIFQGVSSEAVKNKFIDTMSTIKLFVIQ